ncbi:hypothetical protein GGTG_09114 [Gaeumannomyces tritici R3-111a-1]|uniref:Uncharacterized protein n=1 Tax=Gaeumannomyces tritici (strain R3-111a-1) TaxID=644352 RepID=J3P6H4_GAET3|nr:hypothetical protein GGTG_09114 [Gaeumannomyces tritici R3-111a-1]EJT72248.1 hypothetical protein GGTG_09114 [Gaeumannomyces tritici R3-111a-1]
MLLSPQLLLSGVSLLATVTTASRLPHAADMSSSQNPQLAAREPRSQPQQSDQGPTVPTPIICTETNNTESNSTTKTWAQVLSRFPPGSLSATTALPVPGLTVDFRLKVDLNPKIGLGEGPWGLRNWVSFKGGEWSASWGGGAVEAGGQDAQLLIETKATYVDTRYLLITEDETPAHIMVQTTGWRTGPPDVLERLLDPVEGDKVPASDYRFRLFIRLETGDPRYYWVNEGMWLGSGIRRGSEVIYDGYRVL